MSAPKTNIALVVEGHGDVRAAPILVRRIAHEIFGRYDVTVYPGHRVDRKKIVLGEHLTAATRTQAARVDGPGGVLVIFDADDDCPVELAAAAQAAIVHSEIGANVAVVVANREFEAWFLAAREATTDRDPDTVRGAKELVSGGLEHHYRETVDQPRMAATVDLEMAQRRSRSFRRLVAVVGAMLDAER